MKSFFSISRLINACGYSFEGLKSCFRSETAFRQELLVAAVALPIAWTVDVDAAGKALMVGSIFLVLIAELVNTAIEAVVDRISESRHALSKKAKDVGSAVVLLACVNAVCIWSIILLDM